MWWSPVLGSYFVPWVYPIVTAELVLIIFCKLKVSLHSFSICQQCPFVHTMKHDKNCSSSECVSRNTMQGAFTNEVDLAALLFQWRNILSLKSFSAKNLPVTYYLFTCDQKQHFHKTVYCKILFPKYPFWLCDTLIMMCHWIVNGKICTTKTLPL